MIGQETCFLTVSRNDLIRGIPCNEIVWNLTSEEVPRICRETRDSAHPVLPPSVHASVNIMIWISAGQRFILVECRERLECGRDVVLQGFRLMNKQPGFYALIMFTVTVEFLI